MTTVIDYRDPVEGFSGWLAYDGTECRLAAGGCRVVPGLTAATLSELAARMTLKERLLGINVDGAKCGIDYDPRSPGKEAALRRFLAFLRGELERRFSMGCDMGTQFGELERLAALEGIRSVKYAVRRAQGFTESEFAGRLALLDEHLGTLTLSQRRAGHALAQAAIEAARAVRRRTPWSMALQGFGNLGRAAAYTLIREGVRITAIADEFGCVARRDGLDVAAMLATPQGTPVTQAAPGAVHLAREAIFEQPADVLLLAAGEDAMTGEQSRQPSAPVVVVGANCGLSRPAEHTLHRLGVLVIPDFVGGIGGSASMEALFGPRDLPTPGEVLDGVTAIMRRLVDQLTAESLATGRPVRALAEATAARAVPDPDAPPYGISPLLPVAARSGVKS